MSYMWCLGNCYTCGALFSFNPRKVPSLPGHLTKSGEKEAVCRCCIERSQPARKKNGLPPILILPDAYEPEQV